MCEPVTLSTLFMAASVASAGVAAYGSIQQGRAQYQADMYTAQIQERNAQATIDETARVQDAAAIERRRLGEKVRAERGEMIAKYTAMGVDPAFGTPADLVGDITQAYSIDRSILGKNEISAIERLDKERADYTDAARMSRASGKGALKAGYIAAAGSLLDGAASVSSRWITPTPANQNIGQVARPLSAGPTKLKLGAG